MPFRNTPYWRLSGFYFFYFACLGVLVPYWSVYLDWLSFSASEIGELTAILFATRIVAPYIWGWIADHTERHIRIVRLSSICAVISFSLIFIETSYFWVALVMLLFSFFWNGALPQFEVVTLQYLHQNSEHYSKIRVWGSIGFIIMVACLGWLLEHYAASLIPIALLISVTAIWLVSLSVAEVKSTHHSLQYESILNKLKKPDVIAFLTISALLQISHGPYYTFYSLYLEQHDYSRITTGQLWGLGVFAEVIIFLFMHKWIPRYGIKKVLLLSLLLSSLRWLLIGAFVENIVVLTLAQLLHAASFGSYHAAAIAWVFNYFKGKNHGRGQAIYSSVSFGLGGAIGSLYSGYMWLQPGSLSVFVIASILAFLGFVIGLIWLKN